MTRYNVILCYMKQIHNCNMCFSFLRAFPPLAMLQLAWFLHFYNMSCYDMACNRRVCCFRISRVFLHVFIQFAGHTGCSGKIVFLHNSLQPLPRPHRNVSVHSFLLAGNFLFNQYQPSAGEGEVANFREFLEKTQYLMNTLYIKRRPRGPTFPYQSAVIKYFVYISKQYVTSCILSIPIIFRCVASQ